MNRHAMATRLAFWVAGFGVSAWAPLVPYVKARLQVDDAMLGLLLLCLGVGSVTAMLRTGPLCARHGCRPVILTAGAGMALLLPMLVLANAPGWLAATLLLFGGALGSLDVAMNVRAVEVERDAGRPLMSGFHALFSVGGFVGAALVAGLLSLSIHPLTATLVCSAAMASSLWVAAPWLPGRRVATADTATGTPQPGGAWMTWPRGSVVLLSFLAAVTFLVEGALLDWSALLLVGSGLTPAEQAGLGYAMFSVAMTAGRLSGDAITARFGSEAVLRWGGLLAVAGFVLLLLGRPAALAMAGFVLIGLGASNAVPVLFRQAGAQQVMPAALAVSAVTTIGYAGYLLGPAAVGGVSRLAGLPAAFWLLAALMGLVPVCARRACSLYSAERP